LKLLKLCIVAKGQKGLETDELIFGDHFTQLYGPTGTGKTPLVKAIAYCLGCTVKFREEIYNRCDSAILTFNSSSGIYRAQRSFIKGKQVEIEVTDPKNTKKTFYDEESYSEYMFELLGLKNRDLITKSGDKASIYMSSVMPLFYVTQDDGYSSVYKPESAFIKDQFSEMVRFSFNLPEKNPYNLKKNQVDAKNKLDALDQLVSDRKIKLEVLKETIPVNTGIPALEFEIRKTQDELDRLNKHESNGEDSITAISQLMDTRKRRTRDVLSELSLVRNRRFGLQEIKSEIETEVNTLSLNEEARRVFMSFDDICSSDGCQLFSKSSDSYAKNLLYLKDQIKDLESNDRNDDLREIELSKELEILDEVILDLQKEKEKLAERTEAPASLKVISELKLELFKLHSELVDAKKIELSEKDYLSVRNRRDESLNAYEAYKTGGKLDLRLAGLRKKIEKTFIKWLDKLNTSNISYNITFKQDFEPILGNESVNQLSGSTGSRTVLAFHAALLEIAAENTPFNFLILDAPKQHETENIDLDGYMSRLKKICHKHNLQVIFSATEYEYKGDDHDNMWSPSHLLEGKPMFMRPPKPEL